MAILRALDDDLRTQCDTLCAQIDAIIAKQESDLDARRPKRAKPDGWPAHQAVASVPMARGVSKPVPSVTKVRDRAETTLHRIRNVRSMMW